MTVSLFLATPASAQNVTWTGTTSTDWSTASNWSPSGVPAVGANIMIDFLSPAWQPILSNENATVNNLTLGNVTSANLTINAGASLYIKGMLTMGVSSTSLPTLAIGGTLQIGGSSTIHNGQGVGQLYLDMGTLQVVGSDLATSVPVAFAPSSASTIDTNGFNATLSGTISGYSTLIKTGNGTLTIANGSGVSLSVASGNLVVNGGNIQDQNQEIDVGDGTTALATMLINNGANVTCFFSVIGNSVGSNGSVNVTGSGTLWAPRVVTVGNQGMGSLTVSNGAQLNGDLTLGNGNGASGVVIITGAGTLANSNVSLGAPGNTSLLTVSDGATLLGAGDVGSGGNATMTVTGQGTTWTANETEIKIGDIFNAVGNLTISNGAVVSDFTATLGLTGTGNAVVDGAGTVWNTDDFLGIATDGTGLLTIENGGVVNSNGGLLGGNLGSGTLIITGTNSTWNQTSDFNVGSKGVGNMVITNGGQKNDVNGTVANSANSTGNATISGVNSLWANSQNLTVGNLGVGNLTIANGGIVTCGDGFIGGGHSFLMLSEPARWWLQTQIRFGRAEAI